MVLIYSVQTYYNTLILPNNTVFIYNFDMEGPNFKYKLKYEKKYMYLFLTWKNELKYLLNVM